MPDELWYNITNKKIIKKNQEKYKERGENCE